MGGLVPGAAARDQRHLGFVPVVPHDDADMRVTVEPGQPAAGCRDHPVYGFGDDVCLGIDKLGHHISLTRPAGAVTLAGSHVS